MAREAAARNRIEQADAVMKAHQLALFRMGTRAAGLIDVLQ